MILDLLAIAGYKASKSLRYMDSHIREAGTKLRREPSYWLQISRESASPLAGSVSKRLTGLNLTDTCLDGITEPQIHMTNTRYVSQKHINLGSSPVSC